MTSPRGDRRRRFAKACDLCRSKKLRCDGARPVCLRCRELGHECHYADVDKPIVRQRRSRGTAQAPTSVASERSSLARFSNEPDLFSNSDAIPTVAGIQLGRDAPSAHTPSHPSPEEVSGAANDRPLDTIVGGSGDMRYFGPPSGISLASVGTPREPEQQHGKLPPGEESWSTWTHPSVQGAFEKKTIKPLPLWTEAFSLVSDFFSYDHYAFPCFHPPAFMALLGQQYSGNLTRSPAWSVSLNAVLAISQRRRAERDQVVDESFWGYAANALGATLDVLMRSTQLLSVQALLITAWFFVGTPNPQPSFMLVGSALRLAHSIGLHRNNYDSSWCPMEVAMRKKVFWVALSLDREMCLRTGRPPAHDLYGIDVELPVDSSDDLELITTTQGLKVNLFTAQTQLARIQGCIFRTLHSSKPGAADIATSVAVLNRQLEEWRTAYAPSLSLGQPLGREEHHGLIRLYFSYCSAVIVTNRAHSFRYWVSLNLATALVPPRDIKASIDHCTSAARSIVAFTRILDHKWKSFYWDIVAIAASAAIILSINILRDPRSDSAEDDIHAVHDILRVFSTLGRGYADTYLTQLRAACERLYQKAQLALQPLEKQLAPSLQQGDLSWQSTLADNSFRNERESASSFADSHGGPQSSGLDEGAQESLFIGQPQADNSQCGVNACTDNDWALPYSSLNLWSMDMLLGADFGSIG